MKKVTLKQVANKAVKDPKFWKGLRRDSRQTLYDNGMELSGADLKRLDSILSLDGRTLTVDLDRLMARSRTVKPGFGGGVSWIMMWPDLGIPGGPGGGKPPKPGPPKPPIR